MKVVYVASLNPVKVNAVVKAFSLYWKEPFVVKLFSVDTGIPQQPIGFPQIIEGVRNRIENILPFNCKEIEDDETHFCAMENGLVGWDDLQSFRSYETFSNPRFVYDLAAIAVYSYSESADTVRGVIHLTEPCAIPIVMEEKQSFYYWFYYRYVPLANYLLYKNKDFYSYYTNGAITSVQVLFNGIVNALTQLNSNK